MSLTSNSLYEIMSLLNESRKSEMNKRIKELAEQAETHAYRVAAAGDDCQEAYTQKFAELLIKECANIARQTETDDSDDYKSGRTWASLDILEHFGV